MELTRRHAMAGARRDRGPSPSVVLARNEISGGHLWPNKHAPSYFLSLQVGDIPGHGGFPTARTTFREDSFIPFQE